MASACDRLLPSLGEASRLAAALPRARRVTLPDSGHTALLEEGVDLAALLSRAGLLPPAGARSPARPLTLGWNCDSSPAAERTVA